jgi:ferrous iron transport protein A
MNLIEAPRKVPLVIVKINEEKLLNDALRFGIEDGETVEIINKLPGGPVVIQKNQQQIAIGRELASAIEVTVNIS